MSILSFIYDQIYQCKTGGIVVIKRKVVSALRLLAVLPLYPLVVPFVLFVRLINRFIQIRFGPIRSDLIGHLAFAPEYYLSERDADKSKTYDFFYYLTPKLPNKHLPKMYKRVLKLHPIIRYCDRVNRLLPGWEKHYLYLHASPPRDTRNLFMRTPCHVKFTKEEIQKGQQYLKNIGLENGQKYICMIARDPMYKHKYQNMLKKDWSYHSYRDSDINNYVKAAEKLTKYNYIVLRVGKGVNANIETNNDKIIDYSNTEDRDDFLDIYLSANCYFFLVGEAGLSSVPNAYRVPIVFVNFAAVEYVYSWNSNIITIFKKFWLREEKKFMTFNEIYSSGVGKLLRTEEYENLGIELIENTPDEILDASIEMHSRLVGTWESSSEDEDLQRLFWDIFPKNGLTPVRGKRLHGKITARIGSKFLRENKNLLN